MRTMQRITHYDYTAPINVPLQLTLARQALDWVLLGGVDGVVRVYNRATGELVHRLEHQAKGRVQVVDVSTSTAPLHTQPLTHSLGPQHAREGGDCRCLDRPRPAVAYSTLVLEFTRTPPCVEPVAEPYSPPPPAATALS